MRIGYENGDPERVYARVAGRLADLSGLRVGELRVEEDDVRELLTAQLTEAGGMTLPARSLSEGTLRFLALCVLLEDPSVTGLLCMEEPENGIHPANVEAMVDLVRDLAVDARDEPGPDNPFRQVIINTHSPYVVQLVDKDDLLFADGARAGRIARQWPTVAPPGGHLARCSRSRGACRVKAGHPSVPHEPARCAYHAGDHRVIIRVLFIGEGTSDSGIATHILRIVTDNGHSAVITDPLVDRLQPPPRKTVAESCKPSRI